MLALQVGHGGVRSRITHGKQHQQLLVHRPFQEEPELGAAVEGCRCDGDEPCVLTGKCAENTRSSALLTGDENVFCYAKRKFNKLSFYSSKGRAKPFAKRGKGVAKVSFFVVVFYFIFHYFGEAHASRKMAVTANSKMALIQLF